MQLQSFYAFMAKIPILPKMTTKLNSMLLKNSSNWREIHTAEDVNKISQNFSPLVKFWQFFQSVVQILQIQSLVFGTKIQISEK